ncbi:hypothetical protein CRUP_026292 [Coryphaenoides rupestris]|nr:hypothetical protein CRUP_026292 [Coryphaenoides rupestris]
MPQENGAAPKEIARTEAPPPQRQTGPALPASDGVVVVVATPERQTTAAVANRSPPPIPIASEEGSFCLYPQIGPLDAQVRPPDPQFCVVEPVYPMELGCDEPAVHHPCVPEVSRGPASPGDGPGSWVLLPGTQSEPDPMEVEANVKPAYLTELREAQEEIPEEPMEEDLKESLPSLENHQDPKEHLPSLENHQDPKEHLPSLENHQDPKEHLPSLENHRDPKESLASLENQDPKELLTFLENQEPKELIHSLENHRDPKELLPSPENHRDPKESLASLENHRDPKESLASLENQDPKELLPFLENQNREVVYVEPAVVLTGGGGEKEEAVQVMAEESVSLETPEAQVGGEKEEEEQPSTDPPHTAAGCDEEEEEDEEEKKEETSHDVDQVDDSDEDLYRAEEDVHPSPDCLASLRAEGSCSVAPPVDLLSYSQREWRGNTAKSALIRKGYQKMMEGFCAVRRVRGDNYCALRATLFQVLSQTTQPPTWLHDHHIATLLEELEGPEGLLSQWLFPEESQLGDEPWDAGQRLRGYVDLLRNTWESAVVCGSAEERVRLCEGVFQGGAEELGLLEALKLLMLGRAAELHRRMEQGLEVPVFCWLLFARDTSPCPRTLLTNHLRHVGFNGGLEQVEMFLLGYTLRCTIQVYRLYMSATEEFLTYYPDDHRGDWPTVSLVTEDDRHYNVPVVKAEEAEAEQEQEQEAASR